MLRFVCACPNHAVQENVVPTLFFIWAVKDTVSCLWLFASLFLKQFLVNVHANAQARLQARGPTVLPGAETPPVGLGCRLGACVSPCSLAPVFIVHTPTPIHMAGGQLRVPEGGVASGA